MNTEPIFKRICTFSSLFDAWHHIKKKGKAGGIDGVSIEMFDDGLDRNLEELLCSLQEGRYTPEPYERIRVPKEGKPGERRTLSLSSIKDKVVQQAVRRELEALYEPVFVDASFAYRPGRGPADAIKHISRIVASNEVSWVACSDIDNCFDEMNHRFLIDEIRRRVDEPGIIKLITMWIKIGAVTPRGTYDDGRQGIAQGSIISPLLSNIYLHPLDRYMVDRGCAYVRYADNLILLERHRAVLADHFHAAQDFLEKILKMRFNRQKNLYHRVHRGFVYMGIHFKGQNLAIDDARLNKIQNKLNDIARRYLLYDRDKFLTKLKESVRGFENYYGLLLQPKALYPRLNVHLTEAVVDCLYNDYLKQGRKPVKNDIRSLMAGISLFGKPSDTERGKWVNGVADICVERFLMSRKSDAGALPRETDRLSAEKPKAPCRSSTGESAAQRAVRKKKAQYQKLENVSRELVVDTPGTFLGKTARKVVVKRRGVKVFDFPLQRLETINVAAKGVTVSSDLIRYCCEQQVTLFFSDPTGMPWAVLQRPTYGDATLGLLQLQALEDGGIGADLAREFVEGKIRNQINLLKFYRRSRKDESPYGQALIEALPAMARDVKRLKKVTSNGHNYAELRNRLMGLEADAARRYWQLIRILLSDDVSDFPGRRQQGATDLVNNMLNYGYGFLYRQLWRKVVGAGLNPKISFLHAPQGEKPVLIFDLVEEFRPQAVDRVVFSMLTKGERFALDRRNGRLNQSSRQKLLEALLERQASAVTYRGEKVLFKNIIHRQVYRFCRHLRGEDNYQHFRCYY